MKLSISLAVVTCVLCLFTFCMRASGQQRGPQPLNIAEMGEATLMFRDSVTAYAKLDFQREYSVPPLVLVAECGSKGAWILVKTEDVTKAGCVVLGSERDGGKIKAYDAKVAYVVMERPENRK